MTSPIELIRQGILKADWQKVCDGFFGISGVRLDPPSGAGGSVLDAPGLADYLSEMIRDALADYSAVEWDVESDEELEEGPDFAVAGPKPKKKKKPAKGKAKKAKPKPEPEQEVEPPAEEEEPEPDPAASRARQLRDIRTGRADDMEKFRIQHKGPQNTDGKKVCRVEPFKPGMTNTFKDDGRVAAKDIKDSKKFSKTKEPEERRPEVKKVQVHCCKCGNDFEVPPILAPKSLDKGDQSSFVCDGCIRRGKR